MCENEAVIGNYPFTTIEPNVGYSQVRDFRLKKLAEAHGNPRVVPAKVQIVDIAGLIAGASKGEGLGNQFLSDIRMVGPLNPVRDAEIIETELALADMNHMEKRMEKLKRMAMKDPDAQAELTLVQRLYADMNENVRPLRSLNLSASALALLKPLSLLTLKPMIYAANVNDPILPETPTPPMLQEFMQFAERAGCRVIPVAAQLEVELKDVAGEDLRILRQELGFGSMEGEDSMKEVSGIAALARCIYATLGLRTFFTAGPDEVKAWTIRAGTKAPGAAGVIHSDLENGFIRAEVANWEDVAKEGWEALARSGGLRGEGKEYLVQEGDCMLFKFAPPRNKK